MPVFDFPSIPPADNREAIVKELQARTQGVSDKAHASVDYLAGAPYNTEGMMDAFAQKYGAPAAQQFMQKIPYMTGSERAAADRMLTELNREADLRSRTSPTLGYE